MKEYDYRVRSKYTDSPTADWKMVAVFDRDRFAPAIDAILAALESSATHMALPQGARYTAALKLLAQLDEMGEVTIFDEKGKEMYEVTRIDYTNY